MAILQKWGAKMTGYEVFISYRTKNAKYVQAIVAHLENRGVGCWYAPRDILPGEPWAVAIMRALSMVKVMILVMSKELMEDPNQVAREITAADNKKVITIPLRIDDVPLDGGIEYYLANIHWLDVVGKEFDSTLKYIEDAVFRNLGRECGATTQSKNSEQTTQTRTLSVPDTQAEDDFREMVIEALQNGDMIDDSEMKLLRKFQKRLGITDVMASEIIKQETESWGKGHKGGTGRGSV